MNPEEFSKITAAGKAKYKAKVAKDKSLAKSAEVPKTKAAFLADLMPQPTDDDEFRLFPGQVAMCRKVAGGDIYAAFLLYRLAYLWQALPKKLERDGREWLAAPRADWARSAGLSENEIKDRALPRLRRECHGIVEIHGWKLGEKKLLWINLDPHALESAMSGPLAMPDDVFEAQLNGQGIFPPKPPANAYAKPK